MLYRSVAKDHWTESMKDTRQSTNLGSQVALLSLPMQKRKKRERENKSCFCLNIGRKIMQPNFLDLSDHILEKTA